MSIYSVNTPRGERILTVMMDPQTKVCNSESAPAVPLSCNDMRRVMAGPSPARMMTGIMATALNKFVYQERCKALPLTTSRLFLITTEWIAVIAELATPNAIPSGMRGVASRKTPTKKPSVTTEQAKRIRRDGRACKKTKEVPTVKGSNNPRAT